MPYASLPTAAWNDPLGPQRLNDSRDSVSFLRRILEEEHIVGGASIGAHNALEVPRIVRKIGPTAVQSPAVATVITTVTSLGVGIYQLDLAAGLDAASMRFQVNVQQEQPGAGKPHVGQVEVVSPTRINVFTRYLGSALGVAGNTWLAVDVGFDLAIHAAPTLVNPWSVDQRERWRRPLSETDTSGGSLVGNTVTAGQAMWNALVQSESELRHVLTREHDAAGNHNVREVAKAAGLVRYFSTPKYEALDGVGFTSITRTGTGVCELNHAAWVTQTHAFACPDYQRQNGGSSLVPYVVNVNTSSLSKHIAYLYAWDSANLWWQVADGDFFVALHGG